MRLCRESIPVASERDQELVKNLLRRAPGAAVVRKTLGLGPFQLVVEATENAGDVAAPKRFVKTTDNVDCLVHVGIPGLEDEARAGELEYQHVFLAKRRSGCHRYAISRLRALAIASFKPFTGSCV